MAILPTFLIIGSSRSGTTSLYHQLREHPDICMPYDKELNYFNNGWHKGIDWYSEQFADCSDVSMIGEASTSYTWPSPHDIPARIHQTIPNVKLIYIIRNPIDRTFSHYQYNKYRGNESRSFCEAMEAVPLYLSASDYLMWIKNYLMYFNKTNFHLMFAEDLYKNPSVQIEECYSFLGIDTRFVPKSINIKTNKSFNLENPQYFRIIKYIYRYIKKPTDKILSEQTKAKLRDRFHLILTTGPKPNMSDQERELLLDIFTEKINQLELFLGRDLDIWKEKNVN